MVFIYSMNVPVEMKNSTFWAVWTFKQTNKFVQVPKMFLFIFKEFLKGMFSTKLICLFKRTIL